MAAGPTSSAGPNLAFQQDLLAVTGNVRFFFLKVCSTFNPTSTLSEVDLEVVPATQKGHNLVVSAKKLFAFERLEAKPEYEQAFKYIKNCNSKPWPPHGLNSKSLEKELVVALCQNIFVPLSRLDSVLLEKGYTSVLSALGPDGAGLKASDLGIGTLKTWHGTPDVRVRGTEILSLNTSEDEKEDDDDAECSNTATDDIEVKRKIRRHHKALPHVLCPCLLNTISIPKNKQPCQLYLLIQNIFRCVSMIANVIFC